VVSTKLRAGGKGDKKRKEGSKKERRGKRKRVLLHSTTDSQGIEKKKGLAPRKKAKTSNPHKGRRKGGKGGAGLWLSTILRHGEKKNYFNHNARRSKKRQEGLLQGGNPKGGQTTASFS